MLAIGLDIGTTGLCATLIDSQSGDVLKTRTRPNSFFIESKNEWEKIQDAENIFDCIKEMLDEIFSEDVKFIGITGQMHGIVYLDKSGAPVSPLFTWQDTRGSLSYINSTYSDVFEAPAGYGLTTDFYNRINGLVPSAAFSICTIHAFTAMRLCNLNLPILHSSDAASLGHFDIEQGCFKKANPLLPPVTKGVKIIGSYRGAGVCVAVGDNQAGFIGSVRDDGVLINIGTGSQVSIYSKNYFSADGLETRPLDGSECILVGSALCGGRAFALLVKFFSEAAELFGAASPQIYRAIDNLLENEYETDLVFDTRFCGTRSNPDIRASVTNLSESNFTVHDFALATLNGMADELIGFLTLSSSPVNSAVGAGNGIRKNPALRRVLENKLRCSVRVPLHREEAAYGAALCALYAGGCFDSLSDARNIIRYE